MIEFEIMREDFNKLDLSEIELKQSRIIYAEVPVQYQAIRVFQSPNFSVGPPHRIKFLSSLQNDP